eukprot:Awhi_evm2s6011
MTKRFLLEYRNDEINSKKIENDHYASIMGPGTIPLHQYMPSFHFSKYNFTSTDNTLRPIDFVRYGSETLCYHGDRPFLENADFNEKEWSKILKNRRRQLENLSPQVQSFAWAFLNQRICKKWTKTCCF